MSQSGAVPNFSDFAERMVVSAGHLEGLNTEHDELEGQLLANAVARAGEYSRQEQMLRSFFENLVDTPDIYRSVFEIHHSGHELPSTWGDETQEALVETDRHARELYKLDERLTSSLTPQPVLFCSEVDVVKVAQEPAEMVRAIGATLVLVSAGDGLRVRPRVVYNPAIGKTVTAAALFLAGPATMITSGDLVSLADDQKTINWVADPTIDSKKSYELILLQSPTPGSESTPDAPKTPSELATPDASTLYVGNKEIDAKLEILQTGASAIYDMKAVKALTKAYRELVLH